MNKTSFSMLTVLIIFISIIETSYSQVSKTNAAVKEEASESYPIAGSDLLGDHYKKAAQFLIDNPNYFSQVRLKKTAWSFGVGVKRNWTAISFETNGEYSVPSTCRAVGQHCYIFVADDVWETSVDSSAVAGVVNDFDVSTPSNSGEGIFQIDVDTFGNPPDVDNDPRIIILILDIKDGFSGSGGFVAGYFSPDNETRGFGQSIEIYFMDANPVNLKTSSGLNIAITTAAHEFQHMINWNYHRTTPELTFINEGLSEVAQTVCGYGVEMQELVAAESNHYLFDWRTNNRNLVLNDYARAQRFFLYLKEQFGSGMLKQIVQDYSTYGLVGISGLSKILQNYSTTLEKVFTEFEIANGLNNINVDPAYGYSDQPIPISIGKTYYDPNINLTLVTLQNLGAEYFTFMNSSNLNITFSSISSNIIIKAIEIGSGAARVVDVPLNSNFTEPEYPSVYNTIRFAAINTNQNSVQDYQYRSNGTASNSITELKWDNTEPTGYLPLVQGDSAAVQFDGIAGATLDSIKVALRDITPIKGNIFTFADVGGHLGGNKLCTFTATPTLGTKPGVIDHSGDYPYEKPYKNWVKVDLTSQKIDASNPFVVEFPMVAEYPTSNVVMVTYYQSSSAYHSYSYKSQDDPPDWVFYGVQDKSGYIFLYLVRAYVSFVVSGVKHEVELTPAEFSLAQNYPNPFNPSTKIDFSLPKESKVKIIIYNELGQQVSVAVDGEYSAGRHEINFNGEGLASGVYYYRIDAGTYIETKKMILMK